MKVNDTETTIARVTLSPTDVQNTTSTRNTSIAYFVSNNGGAKWHRVKPNVAFNFPSFGSDLRWKATLTSLAPGISPKIDTIAIQQNLVTYNNTTAIAKRNSFAALDTNDDGILSLAESGFATLADLKAYDQNGNGVLTLADLLASTVGPVGVATPVYVNFSYAGTESGTLAQPFNSLLEAATFVANGGAVNLTSGTTNETLTVNKDVTLVSSGGLVRIGAP